MERPQYTVAHLRRALAEDPRTAELGIGVTIRGEVVVLGGEVSSAECRDMIEAVIREQLPEATVHNDIRVLLPAAPDGAETLEPAERG
ncbi:BON domain-containing protein [Nocardia asteroides]|uniref:BON domain-containing protein n=1 Tax=Nocardia asteroides TaxID=1824 RepID=UPI001E463C74|nr:BON domain-containing protein [Nocardia asteroides]UGT60957.1 BON domain-containing protein [Nocardia asteroides]